MTDLKNKKLIVGKAILFLIAGSSAASLLLIDNLSFASLFLLAVTIWAFCRAYYFAFYVLEHYVDSNYSYSGLFSLAKYIRQNGSHEIPQE